MAEVTNKYLLLEIELAKTDLQIKAITSGQATNESRIILNALAGYKENIEWQMAQEIKSSF